MHQNTTYVIGRMGTIAISVGPIACSNGRYQVTVRQGAKVRRTAALDQGSAERIARVMAHNPPVGW